MFFLFLGDNRDRSRRGGAVPAVVSSLWLFLIEFDSDHVAGFAILADFTSSHCCKRPRPDPLQSRL